MKIFNCYVLLPLVIVIGVSKAQNCTNSTSETCCFCTLEQCGNKCLTDFYRFDPPYPSNIGCSLVSTTPSPSSSTATADTMPMTSSGDISMTTNGDTTTMSIENSTLCLRNCPPGFYGNSDTRACLKCSDDCNSCIDSSTCTQITTQITNTTPITNTTQIITQITTQADNTIDIIIGGVCGGVTLIVIVIVVVVVCIRRKQSRLQKRKSKRTFTEKSEVINQAPTGIVSRDEDEEEAVGKPDHHIYENTAQLTRGLSTQLQQNHDVVLRYTPDPTRSIHLMSSRDNEQSEVDQLPVAPAPPKTTNKSKRLTKVKKPKPEPIRDDVYEPVEPVENDTGAHGDDESIEGENYENKQVIAQMKSVRKMSHQMHSKDQEEEDYENDLVLKDLKVDSQTEVGQKPEVDPEQEQDYENDAELERLRKAKVNPKAEPEHVLQDYENKTELEKLRKAEVNPKAEPEHVLQDYENKTELEKLRKAKVKPKAEPGHEPQDYENETMVKKLRKPEVNPKAEPEHELQHYEGDFRLSKFRKPTKDPLTEDQIYENL